MKKSMSRWLLWMVACLVPLVAAVVVLAAFAMLRSDPVVLFSLVNNGRLVFYGIVRDQHGEPVAGARVAYRARGLVMRPGMPDAREGHVTTGRDGRFRIRGGHASALHILDIEKEGYEYRREYEGASFEYRAGEGRHMPDKAAPVAFAMWRKEGRGIFLLGFSHGCSFRGDEPVSMKGHVTWGRYGPPVQDKDTKDRLEPVPDYMMTGGLDKAGGVWNLKFEAPEGAGLLLCTERLGAAPEDGYTGEASLTLNASPGGSLSDRYYLYIRSRQPVLYAEVRFRNITFDGEFLVLSIEETVNPFGGRSFNRYVFNTAQDKDLDLYVEISGKVTGALYKNEVPSQDLWDEALERIKGGKKRSP